MAFARLLAPALTAAWALHAAGAPADGQCGDSGGCPASGAWAAGRPGEEASLLQLHRLSPPGSAVCEPGAHVKCPDSDAMCAGNQCCPAGGDNMSYPCPSADRDFGPGSCQDPFKKSDCLPKVQFCLPGAHVKCPDSDAVCAGNQCCPAGDDGMSYPCPSADPGFGPGRCQDPNKRSNCIPSFGAPSSTLPVLMWNTHFQCMEATNAKCPGNGVPTAACGASARDRFVELVKDTDGNGAAAAQIAAAVELFDPADSTGEANSAWDLLPQLGSGWSQVSGYCKGPFNDQVALVFAPGWTVKEQGGGCLDTDRVFAVALATPPSSGSQFRGCPDLCVVAVHMPHALPQQGQDTVSQVCGAAKAKCTVALGDWNAPEGGRQPEQMFESLVGSRPVAIAPQGVNTCCYKCGAGEFDHVLTNVPGATAEAESLGYQIESENPLESHMPVFGRVFLPGA